ncbi:hypothetical protein [Succinivibrio dextrinosolvens]|uniref:hypothetical protein n=1 Tax=Succinivibrio dextrinosolvens TaxID=83771 RepID=UPI001923061C|nr:hypothetical protein [Succinivibrio dextrinosolvens]
MGTGTSFKCPHCGKYIELMFGVGMRCNLFTDEELEKIKNDHLYGDESLKQKILSGHYNEKVEMMLDELLYKFSEPNPAFASNCEDENGVLLPTVAVYTEKISRGKVFQCTKCHSISRQNCSWIRVNDGLISFYIDITICEKCHEFVCEVPSIQSLSDLDFTDFYCPNCHNLLKSKDFPKDEKAGMIFWD